MITIKFFSSIREALNLGECELPVTPATSTVAGVIDELITTNGDHWRESLTQSNLMCAVNQKVVPLDAPVGDGDEVAFFPPMTGG